MNPRSSDSRAKDCPCCEDGAGRISKALLCLAALAFLLACVPASAARRVDFNIISQRADKALIEFARQAQISVLLPAARIGRVNTNELRGNYELEEALAVLLRDTGLSGQLSAAGTLTIRFADKGGESGMASPSSRKLLAKIVSSIAAAFTLSGHATAADSSAEPSVTLEEITVTARRREENAQTVPIAITVLSPQTLQDNNVKTINDIQFLVPSMSVGSGALSRDTLNVSIRGQGGNGNTGLPAVVAYLNEVPIPVDKDGNLAGGPGLLFDLENVQVLKGPQGTLFGQNSIGGALLLQSARPKSEFGGSVQVGYGNYNNREIDGAVDLPIISDVLLARIAFNGQLRDGYTHLVSEPGHPDGIDTDNRDYWSTRATVTFRPNEAFQNDAILTYQKYTNHGSPAMLVGCSANGAFEGIFPTLYSLCKQYTTLPRFTAGPVDDHLQGGGSLLLLNNISRVNLTENVTFRNIVGYTRVEQTLQLDLDWTSLPLLDITNTPRNQTVNQITDEAQLLGKSFGGRLDWIAGAFYLEQIPPDDPVLQSAIVLGQNDDTAYRQGERSKALFAQGSYDLSPVVNNVKLTGGVRYTWDDHFLDSYGGSLGSICTVPQTNCSTVTHTEANKGTLTWTAGADYTIAENGLLYLTARRGYRDGGGNVYVGAAPFGPEYVTDEELGVKWDWKGSIPARFNADVYDQQYTGIQVPQIISGPGGVPENVTGNAASAKLWGMEIDTLAQLTRDWQIGATFDYLNFKYTSFGAGVAPGPLLTSATDNRPPRKYGLNMRYHLPVPMQVGDVFVRADWHYQDRSGDFSGSGNTGNPAVPAFGLLNMSANWNGIGGGPLDASLYASNLTDKVYVNGGQSAPAVYGIAIRYGEPRMYGIRVRYNFGGPAASR